MNRTVIDVAEIAAQVLAAPEVAREELTVAELAARTPLLAAMHSTRSQTHAQIGLFSHLYSVEVLMTDPSRRDSPWLATTRDAQGNDVTEVGGTRFDALRALWQTVLEASERQGVAA